MGLRRLLLVVSTILIGVAAFARLDPVREGLNATYFTDINWSSAPVLSTVESQPSSDNFRRAWSDVVPEDFSVTWSGKLVILRGGTYTFSIDSDDGSSVYVDRELLIDNPGRHETQRKAGNDRVVARRSRSLYQILSGWRAGEARTVVDERWLAVDADSVVGVRAHAMRNSGGWL